MKFHKVFSRNKNNKGIALILILGVSSVLTALSMAYVAAGIQEAGSSQRYQDSVTTMYEAERGLAYAFVEAQNVGYDWFTSDVNVQANNTFVANGTLTTDSLLFKGNSTGATIGADGNYHLASDIPGANITVRAYANPNNSDEVFLMCRAAIGSTAKIIKTRLSRQSLYKYFYYYPSSKTFTGGSFDGGGAGGIYVNGWVGLGNAKFTNITELSTNKNGALVARSEQYEPPYVIDWFTMDGKGKLPTVGGDHSYNNYFPSPMGGYGWPPQWWPPMSWRAVGAHFDKPGSINGISLPKQFSTKWEWKKFSGWSEWYDKTYIPQEKPVKFYDPSGAEATSAYWETLSEQQCGAGKKNNDCGTFDPDFWGTKSYQRKSKDLADPDTLAVDFFNTYHQPQDWSDYLEGSGKSLKGVVKERNTGGYDVAIPQIDVSYSKKAKEAGLYIGEDEVFLNGAEAVSLPGCIKDNVEFFNTVRPKLQGDKNNNGLIDSGETVTALKENVLEINIGDCIASGEVPSNGVIYVAHKNIRLTNGTQLPEDGLTVVSPYNVYIKGNYNHDPSKTEQENSDNNYQPASVISNSYVYVLSDAFNDPQELPAYNLPREYPTERNNINTKNLVQGTTDDAKGKRLLLQNEIKSFFGIANFDIVNNPPASIAQLEGQIRAQYTKEYANKMPNVAGKTKVRTAIASTKDMAADAWNTNYYYFLEKWTAGSEPVIQGAFVRLGSSWANNEDGTPIQDTPPTYWGKRTGGANSWNSNPANLGKRNWLQHINTTVKAALVYETGFATGDLPPMSLLGGIQSSWQEVSDFDHA